jgi:anti-sigma B factor antagonist
MSSFQTRDESDVLVITLEDAAALNDFRANTFREALYEAVQLHESPRVVLDMGVADYLSSSGVAILVGLKRRVDGRSGQLILARVHPVVQDLLRIMKLTQYFAFAPEVKAGIETLRPLAPRNPSV